MEEEEVDVKELKEQVNQKIKESGHYIEFYMILGEENECGIPSLNVHNVTAKEIAGFLLSLEQIQKHIEKQYPEAVILKKMYNIQTYIADEDGKNMKKI